MHLSPQRRKPGHQRTWRAITFRSLPPRTAPWRPSVRIREPPAGLFRSADGRRC